MRIPAREAKEWAKEKLVGVMDAMPIACTEEGEMDEAGLRKIVRYHYDGMKSDGIVALAGPEGFWYLTKEERKKYTEIVIDEANKVKPDAPVIVGTLCVSVKDVVELIKHAEGAGATAVIMKNPVFATDEVGLYDFYRYIADNTDIAIGRAEDIAHEPQYREKFELVLSRAVAPLATLAGLTLPFCAAGGIVVAFKKGAIELEVKQAATAISLLGGKLRETKRVELEEFTDERYLVVIDKVSPTPPQYPRRPGMPKKRPL